MPPVSPSERTPGFEPVLDAEITEISLDSGARIAVWVARGGAVLWATLDGRPGGAAVLARDSPPPTAIDVSGDGRSAALASARRVTIHAIPAVPGAKPVRVDTPEPVRSVAFDQSGRRIAIGLEDGRVGIWGTSDGAPISVPSRLHDSPVSGVLFAPDDRRVVSFGAGDTDRTIAVTPVDRLAEPRRLQMRQAGGAVTRLALSAPAGLLAAADNDGQVLLWGLADLGWITALTAGGTHVSGLAFDDRSRRLIAASSDRGLLSWPTDPADWARAACRKANRDLTRTEWTEVLPDDAFRQPCRALRSAGP
jgi:WD40 repeat protein